MENLLFVLKYNIKWIKMELQTRLMEFAYKIIYYGG